MWLIFARYTQGCTISFNFNNFDTVTTETLSATTISQHVSKHIHLTSNGFPQWHQVSLDSGVQMEASQPRLRLLNDFFHIDYIYDWTSGYHHHHAPLPRRWTDRGLETHLRFKSPMFFSLTSNSPDHLNDNGQGSTERFNMGWRHRYLQPSQYIFPSLLFLLY